MPRLAQCLGCKKTPNPGSPEDGLCHSLVLQKPWLHQGQHTIPSQQSYISPTHTIFTYPYIKTPNIPIFTCYHPWLPSSMTGNCLYNLLIIQYAVRYLYIFRLTGISLFFPPHHPPYHGCRSLDLTQAGDLFMDWGLAPCQQIMHAG